MFLVKNYDDIKVVVDSHGTTPNPTLYKNVTIYMYEATVLSKYLGLIHSRKLDTESFPKHP